MMASEQRTSMAKRISAVLILAMFSTLLNIAVTPPAHAATCPYPTASEPSNISATPLPWARTNGDILTGALIQVGGQPAIAIGGNFTSVIEPDGRVVAAKNLAVIREATGKVLYAVTANSYVRSLSWRADRLYAGGNFTTLGGKSRSHIGAIDTINGQVTAWAPTTSGVIYAVAASDPAVYYGGSGTVRAVTSAGAPIWSLPVSQGPVRSLLVSPDQTGLYVGGQFEKVGTLAQHGAVAVYPALSGVVVPSFAPHLLADTESPVLPGGMQTWNGEEVLSMTWDNSPGSVLRLVLGIGGGTHNALRSVDPAVGGTYWEDYTEGDTQALALINGTSLIGGNHRGHGNDIGCPYPFQVTRFSPTSGMVLTGWDPRLSGTVPGNADGGNGGVWSIIHDQATGRLIMLGAFTRWNATGCLPDGTLGCTGGTNVQSAVMFGVA